MKILINNENGHGLASGIGALLAPVAIVTAPIWGPVWLVRKGYKKIKKKIKSRKK